MYIHGRLTVVKGIFCACIPLEVSIVTACVSVKYGKLFHEYCVLKGILCAYIIKMVIRNQERHGC